jgi:hypothetical protein
VDVDRGIMVFDLHIALKTHTKHYTAYKFHRNTNSAGRRRYRKGRVDE